MSVNDKSNFNEEKYIANDKALNSDNNIDKACPSPICEMSSDEPSYQNESKYRVIRKVDTEKTRKNLEKAYGIVSFINILLAIIPYILYLIFTLGIDSFLENLYYLNTAISILAIIYCIVISIIYKKYTKLDKQKKSTFAFFVISSIFLNVIMIILNIGTVFTIKGVA